MIASAAIFQIVGCCLAVQGILTQETPRHLNWQELLKEATYRSLIAHTDLSPSLEEKMETDRLVWGKIQGARFLRKSQLEDGGGVGGGEEAPDRIKTGILVDMTAESGGLEFRQTERSMSRCQEDKCRQVLKRLLAVWKIQKFEPNDIWIRIQLPRNFASEDVYEYTPKLGLQKLDVQKWKENLKMKAERRKDEDGDFQVARRQGRQFGTTDFNKHILSFTSGYRDKQDPYSSLNGPTSYFPQVIDITVPQKYQSRPWREGGTYYQVNPISTVLAQYQREAQYDGFLPSMGPTGLPHATYVHPVKYEHVFRNYITDPRPPPYQPTTPPNYFKPSTQFVHFSEPDPLYHEDPNTSQATTLVYPDEVFEYRSHKTTEPAPILVYSETTTDNAIQSTEGSFNAINFNEAKPNKDENIVRIPGNPRRTPHTKPTSRPKPIHRDSSVEAFDYAPLHAKWGEKIKINVKNKTVAKTFKVDSQVTRPPLKLAPRNNSTTATTTTESTTLAEKVQTLQPTQTVYANSTLPTTTTEISTTPSTSTTTETIKSINMRIDDIKTRTPEEIVNALTNIGVINSTRVEGYPEIRHETLFNSTRLLDQIQAAAHDQAVDSSNPISVIINRISHSYSYKTARGLKKDVKLFPLKRF